MTGYFGEVYFGGEPATDNDIDKTGAPVGAGVVGGTKAITIDKSGGVSGAAVSGSPKSVLVSKTSGTSGTGALGGVASLERLAGVVGVAKLGGVKLASIDKAAGPRASASLGAPRTVARDESGGIAGNGVLGGPGQLTVPRTGGTVVGAVLGGSYTLLATLNKTGGPKARGRFGFEGPDRPWAPPRETDAYYARLPFHESQRVLGAAAFSGARPASCEWHHTAYDAERGAFGIARRDGPLADLVGQRVRVVLLDGSNRSVVVFVHESGDMDEDFSLTRRAFMALDAPSRDRVETVVQPKVLVG